MITANQQAVFNMKACKACGEHLSLDCFELLNAKQGWTRGVCKSCIRERKREWDERSKEKLVEYHRSYYAANREKIIGRVKKWVDDNPVLRRKNALSYYYRLQDAAIHAYGGYQCNWCGIEEPLVLCIDHIANNGSEHRKELGTTGGAKLYKWLQANDYPDGFQVLCMNCNHAKYRNKGILPDSLKGRCND